MLKVISRSPGQLEPVFNAMLENAVKICGAEFGMLYRFEDDSSFRPSPCTMAATRFAVFTSVDASGGISPCEEPRLGRILRTRQVAHIADIRTERATPPSPPFKDLWQTYAVVHEP